MQVLEVALEMAILSARLMGESTAVGQVGASRCLRVGAMGIQGAMEGLEGMGARLRLPTTTATVLLVEVAGMAASIMVGMAGMVVVDLELRLRADANHTRSRFTHLKRSHKPKQTHNKCATGSCKRTIKHQGSHGQENSQAPPTGPSTSASAGNAQPAPGAGGRGNIDASRDPRRRPGG